MKDNGRNKMILIAEDNPDDRLLVEKAFQRCMFQCNLVFVRDGVELLKYLHCHERVVDRSFAPLPDLILLDLNMPNMDGRETLAAIKSSPGLHSIPVVVVTSSTAERDVMLTYDRGGAGFITKPVSFSEMVDIVNALNQYWFTIVEQSNSDGMNRRMGDTSGLGR